MRLPTGARLGRFEIVALAGAGAMGEVYRARDPELAREVAIKVLPPGLANDPSRLQRFEREARAAGRLDHPNLLAVHELGRHQGAPYLVSELLERTAARASAPETEWRRHYRVTSSTLSSPRTPSKTSDGP